jgi:KDO2-lipid IV(A) lauroyltransferase
MTPEPFRRIRYGFVRALFWPVARLPRRAGLAVMGGLGRVAWWVLPSVRARLRKNLQRVFPGQPPRWRDALARRSLVTLGRNALDFLRLARCRPGRVPAPVVIRGLHRFHAAYRRGRGVLVVTLHAGCWELLAPVFAALGYPVWVVARPLREERWERWVRRARERHGVRILPLGTPAHRVASVLRRGGVVGLLVDYASGGGSVPLPFLGVPAPTPLGPARLSRLTGAPVVPMGIRMDGEGRHVITVGPTLEPPAGRGWDETALAAAWNAILGSWLLERPEQWVWFHDRWPEKGLEQGGAAPVVGSLAVPERM